MGVRGVVCAIGLAGIFVLAPSEAVRAGCNPNLAWQDRYPSWGAGTIAFGRESVGCGGAPELVVLTTPDGKRANSHGQGVSPAVSRQGRVAWTNEFSRIEVDGVDVTGGAYPAWSPSGQSLAFLRGEELWVRDMRTRQERRLADIAILSPFTQAPVTTPSWSPDGGEIAFVGPGLKLSVARPDGTGVRKLTSGLDRQVSPAWSPDGVRIAFISDRGDSFDIWSIRPDGTGTQRLTDDPEDETLPRWAPDGQRIAFIRETGESYGEAALWLMGGEGGFERLIGTDAHAFSQPAWSPDGKRIVFASGRECLRWGLYVVRLKGASQPGSPIPAGSSAPLETTSSRAPHSSTSSSALAATMCCTGSRGAISSRAARGETRSRAAKVPTRSSPGTAGGTWCPAARGRTPHASIVDSTA